MLGIQIRTFLKGYFASFCFSLSVSNVFSKCNSVEENISVVAGSAFYHGSGSELGQQMDQFMISLLAYLLHQASLTGLTSLPAQLTHLAPGTDNNKDLYRREGKGRCCCLGGQNLFNALPHLLFCTRTIWREGKGRHCCLEDRIYSIPCRASYFAPGWYEEKDELHQDDMKKRMK